MPWGSGSWGSTPWGNGGASPASAPATSTTTRPPPRGLGRDIWLDVAAGERADRLVTPARDWRLTEGDEALAQWVRRAIITSPGEWATDPDYGCGARDHLYALDTDAARAELATKIRVGLLRNPRIARVEVSFIDWPDPGVFRVGVVVASRANPGRAVPVTTEVT